MWCQQVKTCSNERERKSACDDRNPSSPGQVPGKDPPPPPRPRLPTYPSHMSVKPLPRLPTLLVPETQPLPMREIYLILKSLSSFSFGENWTYDPTYLQKGAQLLLLICIFMDSKLSPLFLISFIVLDLSLEPPISNTQSR